MAHILAIAENFGFGPTGRLLTVLDILRQRHEISYVGFGSSLDLARKQQFAHYFSLNSQAPSFYDQFAGLLKNVDLLISSQDRPSVDLALKCKVPTAYIDGLFWRWDDIPNYLQNVDAYIKINNQLERESSPLLQRAIKHLKLVGPIVDSRCQQKKSRSKSILISLGGFETINPSLDKDLLSYITHLTSIVIAALPSKNPVIITSNQIIIEHIKQTLTNIPPHVAVESLSHDRFIEQLVDAQLLIATPGGQTSFEAFASKTAVLFLPPVNDTQYAWLESFREHNCGQLSIALTDYFEKIDILHQDFAVVIKKIRHQLNELSHNEQIIKGIDQNIKTFLTNHQTQRLQQHYQTAYLGALGSDGLTETVKAIEELLS